jgi:hypothetical protein
MRRSRTGGSSKHKSGPRLQKSKQGGVEPDESDNQAFLEAMEQEETIEKGRMIQLQEGADQEADRQDIMIQNENVRSLLCHAPSRYHFVQKGRLKREGFVSITGYIY